MSSGAGILLGVSAILAALVIFTLWNARRAERLVPPDGQFIDLPGARLHYLDIGTGPAIVMVHGLGGQMRNFTYALSDRLASDHRLIIIDRPGSGYSAWTDQTERGLFAQARVVASLIDRLQIGRPLVVGHSLGGAVALALAAQQPERISGLALLAPLTQPIDTINKVFAALTIKSHLARWLVAWLLAALLGRLTQSQSGAEVFGPEPIAPDFEARAGAALTLRPAAFLAASADVDACRAEMGAIAARHAGITVPVGILFAREDRLLDFELHGAATARAIPGCTLTPISGGHMFPLTQPGLTADWIRERAAR
ncbi:MAG: alpha/beta hydrolase [Proteobacteria bacterium]|nr:alpha/beta hydrolase [Pseudomonadota bacterium]